MQHRAEHRAEKQGGRTAPASRGDTGQPAGRDRQDTVFQDAIVESLLRAESGDASPEAGGQCDRRELVAVREVRACVKIECEWVRNVSLCF